MPKVHALASYGLLNYPEIGGDYARTGIALYGVLSCASHAVPRAAALQPVLSLKTRVAQVQMLQPGERAGYDLRFTARRETRLAVLSMAMPTGCPGACPAAWVQCCSMAVVRRRGPHLYGSDSGGRHGDP